MVRLLCYFYFGWACFKSMILVMYILSITSNLNAVNFSSFRFILCFFMSFMVKLLCVLIFVFYASNDDGMYFPFTLLSMCCELTGWIHMTS